MFDQFKFENVLERLEYNYHINEQVIRLKKYFQQ